VTSSVRVSDLVASGEAELTTGPFGTQLKAAEYVETGIPVINVRNVGFGEIRASNLEFIPEATAQRLSRHLLLPGDIVFGRKGAVERHGLVADRHAGWLQGSDCLRLRLHSDRYIPRFVSYYLLTERHKQWMKNHCSHGATMASLNQDILGRIELPEVGRDEQRRIASILSAYDDLIENNTRRIQILEAMAQAIYREWFVEFRFPGHEGVRMVDSALGPIPEGWRVLPLSEVCARMQSGSTPRRNELQWWDAGDLDWYTTNELRDGFLLRSVEQITQRTLRAKVARIFEPGTILMAIYGSPTVGRLGILTSPSSCNQAALGMVADENLVSQPYLYWCLRHLRIHFNSIAQGAAQQNISKAKVASTDVLVPNFAISQAFEIVLAPLWDLQRNLTQSVANLRQTRDLLLPRLISGEIDVSDLDLGGAEPAA